jgi:GNAT superfamily N-acetyltransferase
MRTRALTKADFDHVVEVIDRWWGGPISTFAHPIFFYELGEQALVAEEDGVVIGFLLGFIASGPSKTGYVHLVGIHPDHRRKGVGRALYRAFADACSAAACVRLKAITTHANEGSIRFHLALGWTQEEVEDYAGPSRKRLVFTQECVRQVKPQLLM